MTNEQLIHTVKEAMRNDTVLNKGMVELLCNALVAVTEQRDALVVENVGLKGNINKLENWPGLEFYSSAWEFNKSDGFDASELICDIETPATDAARASLRAEGVDIARNALIAFVEDEVGPNENVPGLIRGAEVCVSIARQLRESKGESKL